MKIEMTLLLKYQNKWILIYIYLLEVLIAFKVVISPSSWVTHIIDPERYWAPPKQIFEVVVVVVVVIPALPEKP